MSTSYNLADLFELIVDTVPDKEALVCGNTRHTFAQLDARANQLAHVFAARGIGAGDHIGLHLFNSAEFCEVMLAAMKIRAVPININYRYVAGELAYLFDNADLVALVHQREFGPVVADAAARVSTLKHFFYVEDGSGGILAGLDAVNLEAVIETGSPERDFETRSPKDHYLIYTGGTTGMPRGVVWEHDQLLFAGLQGANPGDDDITSPEQLGEILAAGREPMHIQPAAPLIHGAAQFATWIAWFTGGKVVLSTGRSFDARENARLIGVEGTHVINLVGDAMAAPFAKVLLEEGAEWDTSTVIAVSSAGAILSRHIKEELEKALPYAMILNNLGASETGHQGTAIDMGDGGRPRFFMIGDSTKVLDDDLNLVEPGSGIIGRIARRGPMPIGYYKDPEKTARTFFIDRDGTRWVIPGDLGIPEDDGTITLLGRGAICINTGGEKVFPEEVEEALKSHPGVEDAVVVGIPDERWGERVTALVQLEDGVDLDTVLQHCRTKVAGYKTPRQMWAVRRVHRHPSGKPEYAWAKDTAIELSGTEGS
jgi:acyl-CoA synthetase (AMP-forming)/AMP-acid ligase II